MFKSTKTLLMAFALVLAPLPALAQTDTGTPTNTTNSSDAGPGQQGTAADAESTRGFPWGLLGLLGLAGLMRRNDRREVHLGGPTAGPRS